MRRGCFAEVRRAQVAASLTPGRNNGFVNMLNVVKAKVAALDGASSSLDDAAAGCDAPAAGGSGGALADALAVLQPDRVDASGTCVTVVASCFEGLAVEKRLALVAAVLGDAAEGLEVSALTPGEA